MRLSAPLLCAALAAGCSGGPRPDDAHVPGDATPDGAPAPVDGATGADGEAPRDAAAGDAGGPVQGRVSGPVTASATWCDAVELDGTVEIAAGATVTLCPGLRVTARDGAGLVVAGALVAAAAATHVTIRGANWAGIAAASGGRLALDGVDVAGGARAIEVRSGAMPGSFDHGSVQGAGAPFVVGAGAALTVANTVVRMPTGQSTIAGTLHMTRVDYDSAGQEGIVADDPAAAVTITDSRLTTRSAGTDLVVISPNGAASLVLAHNELYGSHCATHLNRSTSLLIHDNVYRDNQYAFMLGGAAGAASRRIYRNNIVRSAAVGIQEISPNEAIDARGNYFAMNARGDTQLSRGSQIDASGRLAAPVEGAGPRP